MGIFDLNSDSDDQDDTSLFGTGKSRESRTFEGPVHGTTDEGREVTAAFGKKGTSREDHTLLADGHKSADEFHEQGQHDHYDGKGGGTQRGHYTGKGS